MPDSTIPASPPEPEDSAGSHAIPSGTPDSPPEHGQGGREAPTPPAPQEPQGPPPTQPSATSSGGGRGGCMTAMIGLFVFIAALLGIATQL
ncbi:hypothetical protein [Dactylosporangium salmoneum]|uniref:Uncharacterized protein n=1 Tax=Dactylosporangium salmoneum TaxID=53361 RepID=A0ABP5UYA2_9ACTN